MRSPCLDIRICKGVCSHLNGFWRQCFGVNGENYLKLLCESMHLKSTLKPFSAFSIVYERLISHRIKIGFTLIWLGRRQQLPPLNNHTHKHLLQLTVLSGFHHAVVIIETLLRVKLPHARYWFDEKYVKKVIKTATQQLDFIVSFDTLKQ